MKNVPHWQLLVVVYFLLVAVPVYVIHFHLKKRALANRTFLNLIFYVTAVIGAGFIMHYFTMWVYFTFFFTDRN